MVFVARIARAYLGVLAAHFVVDAGIWRLRDPFVRAFPLPAGRLPARIGAIVRCGPLGPVADRSVADIGWGTWP